MKKKRPFLNLLFILFFASLSFPAFAEAEKSLEERVYDLEFANMFRRFNINGEILNHYENYQAEKTLVDDTSGEEYKANSSIYAMATLFQLNVNFDVTDRMKVFSRLGMAKFWNQENHPRTYKHSIGDDSWDSSEFGSYAFAGSTPKFDRAYMSYDFAFAPLTMAIGRMPTYNGPPNHQFDAKERTGTYPRFAYNAIFDGLALAYDFTKYLGGQHHLNWRFFYTPYTNLSESSRTERRTVNSSGTPQTAHPSTDGWTSQIDYSWKDTKFFEALNFTAFWYRYLDFFQSVPDDKVYDYEADAYLIYAGLEGVMQTGLNLSLSRLKVKTDAIATDTGAHTESISLAHLANINYRFKNGWFRDWVAAAEYIHTDAAFYIDEFAYYTLSDFYKVPNNNGLHYLVSFPVLDSSRLRIGVFDYRTKGAADPDADTAKKTVRSFYSTLSTTF